MDRSASISLLVLSFLLVPSIALGASAADSLASLPSPHYPGALPLSTTPFPCHGAGCLAKESLRHDVQSKYVLEFHLRAHPKLLSSFSAPFSKRLPFQKKKKTLLLFAPLDCSFQAWLPLSSILTMVYHHIVLLQTRFAIERGPRRRNTFRRSFLKSRPSSSHLLWPFLLLP